jgi:hypothetical protein
MKNFVRSFLVVAAFMVSQSASAALLVEPILGYNLGTYKVGADKGKVTGVLLGARAGVGLGPIILAADIGTGTNKIKSDTVGGLDDDAKVTNMGLTALFSPPVLPVRVWAGYIFKTESKTDLFKFEGNGLKVGAGFSLIPFVSLNAEYIMSTYNKANGMSLVDDLKVNSAFISVSVPLEI